MESIPFAALPKPEQEQLAARKLLEFYEEWISLTQDWIRPNAGRPEPGTIIARANDLKLPGEYSPSDLVWLSLIGAADHLMAAVQLALHSRSIYSIMTTGRTALVGACQALWLMDGDAQQQRASALKMAHNIFYHERQSLDEILQLPNLKSTDKVGYEAMKARKAECIRLLETIKQLMTAEGVSPSFPETFKNIIKPALASSFGDRSADFLAVADLWRQGSMTAHAVLPLSMTAAIQHAASDSEGNQVVHYSTNYASHLNTVAAAYKITTAAVNDWLHKAQPSQILPTVQPKQE